jgi:hypothetical protein
MQSLDCLLQQAAVMPIFQKLLKQILNFAHAGEKFFPDKIQGCGAC